MGAESRVAVDREGKHPIVEVLHCQLQNTKMLKKKNNNDSMLSQSIVEKKVCSKILQITKDLILLKVKQKAGQRKSWLA